MARKSMRKYKKISKGKLAKRIENQGKVKSKEFPFYKHSIIGYKKPRDMSQDDFNTFIDQAANDVLARFGVSTIVVGVKKWDEIRILDEKIMESSGWVRLERVFLLKEELDLSIFSEDEIRKAMLGIDEEE